MKKIFLTLFISMGLTLFGNAQEPHPCHQVEKTNEFLQTLSPSERVQYKTDQEAYFQEIQTYIQNHPEVQESTGARAIQYRIPVVFHIIHAGGPENISDAQVKDCIRIMNDDYQKLNSDANNVQSEFQSIVADAEIEFVLARKDPNGNCTNGITRTFSFVTFDGDGSDRVAAVQAEHGNWPGNRYMNVFVADNIGGAAGYTYRPSNWVGSGMSNGIHVLHNYVGSIGTSGIYSSRTMTHEAGHWFDLPHLWGGTNSPGLASNCNDDDGVADTPNTEGWTSCNLQGTTCDANKDNVENYMEYSYCSKMFTNGQKARMHGALNSSTGGRNNLHTASNLSFTGVSEPEVMCKADFRSDLKIVCAGQTISFTDNSFHAPSGWTWSFPGGTPSSSTSQNPQVTYNTPGTYEVTLTATDGTNSKSITRAGYITVLEQAASLTFEEGFESYSSLATSPWVAENLNGNGFELEHWNGNVSLKSVRLNNFGEEPGSLDNLYSSTVDLSGITNSVTMSFRYAYRKRISANNEWLRVYISKDCGANWVLRKSIQGDNLSEKTSTEFWEPSSNGDWTTVHMTNITSSYWVDNFRARFEFESDGGNNFFIDNINIFPGEPSDDPLSLTENDEIVSAFNIYPNPASDEANVEFTIENDQSTKVEILNTIGQPVQTTAIKAASGKNLVMLNTSGIQSGIYFVRVSVGGAEQIKRLVIK